MIHKLLYTLLSTRFWYPACIPAIDNPQVCLYNNTAERNDAIRFCKILIRPQETREIRMNILHLKYAVEVEKARSITKAAENLFMGQPNLSRSIKELEETLGITIFKRTSKGIVPTAQGEEFLSYAKGILAQIDEIESMYRHDKEDKLAFNISIPRASYITHAFTKLVANLDLSKEIEFNYKETNAMRAINNILQSNYNLGIIRYQSVFEDYFAAMMNEKDLKCETIWEFNYLALMSARHPLAQKKEITYTDLSAYIEIAHGDPYVPSLPFSQVKKMELSDLVNKRIFVYERGSQFDLLTDVPTTYIWVSPIPKELLDRYDLVQRVCVGANRMYKDVLIYRNHYKLSEIDKAFIEELKRCIRQLTEELQL